ncbi:MAG TPA: ABC transporter permease [Anaerolineales bacterium]|jgi:ribose/xylose/arabinose/galactoside ABC-type transport system permease subunit
MSMQQAKKPTILAIAVTLLRGLLFLGGTAGSDRKRRWIDYAILGSFLLLILVAATMSDVFFTQRNLSNLMRQIVTNGLISLGMLVVILTGGIDLSVGPVVAFSAIVVSGMIQNQHLPLPLAILIALGVGGLAGAFNGFMVSRFKLQPFIVTLATLGAIRGLVYVYSQTPITPQDPSFRTIFGTAILGPFTLSGLIMLLAFLVMLFFINRTTAGRAIVAIGGNEEAVRLAGINVRRHILLAYIISGLCAALAGVLLASRLGIAQPSVGAGFELDAIAACVIGGAILGGGGGSVLGTFGGVVILGVIDNLLNLLNVQSYYQQIFKGLIILFAVLARRKDK